MEQDLKIYENGQYKNIYPKTKYKRNGPKLVLDENNKKIPLYEGLDDGNHIVVEKTSFAEGKKIEKPTYVMYVCQVTYKGEDVSFVLYETEHAKYASAGDVGDKVRITLRKESVVNQKTGNEMMVERLYFDKVEE